jgi:hypothetical protein
MTDFQTFLVDISKPMEEAVRRQLDRADRTSSQSVLFDVEVPFLSPNPRPVLPPHERFAVDSFEAFTEVSDTFQRLRDIEVYVRRFPFRGTRITRERYIRFHVEAYLHETYILRERLAAFATRATRAYRKTKQREFALAVEKQLMDTVSSLDGIIAIRSRHVHELRFDETRLRNLNAIELIERNSSDPIWSNFLKQQYPKVRKYWASWVREMNQAIEQLLDQYFGELHRLMFDQRGFRSPYPSA